MGYAEMKNRIIHIDKNAQNRQIAKKRQVLKKAIDTSYFGFSVTKPEVSEDIVYRVLITGTTSNLGDSELKKDFSSFFEDDFSVGTVIHWLKNDSYWLIYEREQSEIAYFQGKMIEAKNYQIITEDGIHSTWGSIALTQDNETDRFDETLITREKSILKIMIPKNEQNMKIFSLDKKIKVIDTMWKIFHVDYISKNGVIIIKAERSFDKEEEVIINENPIVNDNTYIDGPNVIEPFEEVTYRIAQNIEGFWSIPENPNIKKTINNDNSLTIVWTNGRKRNDFTITFGNYSKNIQVKSAT